MFKKFLGFSTITLLPQGETIEIQVESKNSMNSMKGFHLVTTPESSGSPPRRAPPSLVASTPTVSPDMSSSSRLESFNSSAIRQLSIDYIKDFEDTDQEEVSSSRTKEHDAVLTSDILPILPTFVTGISDHDLCGTAYEILLACYGALRGLDIPDTVNNRKGRKLRLIRRFGRATSPDVLQKQYDPGFNHLLETMRAQMEISEAMDLRTRKGLRRALTSSPGKRIDALLIPLELLRNIPYTDFSDLKSYSKWKNRQLSVLEEGLIHHPYFVFKQTIYKNELDVVMERINECKSRSSANEVQPAECFNLLKEVAVPFVERCSPGEHSCQKIHWADGFPLNVKLYEKLLLCAFDFLDEAELAVECESIFALIKLTWNVLGITEIIHNTCFAFVLFRKFVHTKNLWLLEYSVEHLKKIPPRESWDLKEGIHPDIDDSISFFASFLSPLQDWADKQLEDYHSNFPEGSQVFENILFVAVLSRRLMLEESGLETQKTLISEFIQSRIYSSMRNAFTKATRDIKKLEEVQKHPLALLAEELKLILKNESTLFSPILSRIYPPALACSLVHLHRLYGDHLNPFLDCAEHLTEDAICVFREAHQFEQYLLVLNASDNGENVTGLDVFGFTPYQIAPVSGTMVLQWINIQLGSILGWIERAISQEVWAPISLQLKHGSSIIEVFRIVEETVDQFFALGIPMRHSELQTLLLGIDNAFQLYGDNAIGKLPKKEDLIPPIPILARHRKDASSASIKTYIRKELSEHSYHVESKQNEIDVPTTSTLCVKLNSLYYATQQLNNLEDSIWDRWISKKPYGESRTKTLQTTFQESLKTMNAAIDALCEFTAMKIIFWDLRVAFIENLYNPTVSNVRLDVIIEKLDVELDRLCDVIVEPLRDRVVTCLLQASLDGLLRVLLDGGSSRTFFPSDAVFLEEDLDMLKEFFISGGDGLPRAVVEDRVERVHDVIRLHSYEACYLVQKNHGFS